MSYFSVSILTPYKVLARDISVQSLHIPTTLGEINVLPEHTHLIVKLDTGILTCHAPEQVYRFMVTTGIAKVLKNTITILTQVAERAEDIDIERARRALELAKSKLSGKDHLGDQDLDKFRRKLARAFVRQELVK